MSLIVWEINGLELELDLEDVETMEKYENAFNDLAEIEKRLVNVGKASDITRAYCQMYIDLFDAIFEKGTSEKIFKGKYNSRLCEEAYESFIAFCNKQVKSRNERLSKLSQKYRPKGR